MGFTCKIFGHKWNCCTCVRCSAKRDEQHNWNGCTCSCCGKARDEQHNWNGCKCSRCGKVRDSQHTYVFLKSTDSFCEDICTQCGKKRKNKHIAWSIRDRECSRCALCGRVTGELHDFKEADLADAEEWHNATCQRCGITKKEVEEKLNEKFAMIEKGWEMANGTGRTGW